MAPCPCLVLRIWQGPRNRTEPYQALHPLQGLEHVVCLRTKGWLWLQKLTLDLTVIFKKALIIEGGGNKFTRCGGFPDTSTFLDTPPAPPPKVQTPIPSNLFTNINFISHMQYLTVYVYI